MCCICPSQQAEPTLEGNFSEVNNFQSAAASRTPQSGDATFKDTCLSFSSPWSFSPSHSAWPKPKLVGMTVLLRIFCKVWNLSGSHNSELSGPDKLYRQGSSVERKQPVSFEETSETMDGKVLGNVANNNNDQTNVNTVNNMNTAVQSNSNNVNVLDVILVGSPIVSHQPIGWNTNLIHMALLHPEKPAINKKIILVWFWNRKVENIQFSMTQWVSHACSSS